MNLSVFHLDQPRPKIFNFCCFAIFGPIFFPIFVLLAGNVVLCQCHSIAHVLALYFLVKADLFDLTRQDKKDPGQKGSRTKWIQDKSVFFFHPFGRALFHVPLAYVFQKLFFWPSGFPQGPFFCQNYYLEKVE